MPAILIITTSGKGGEVIYGKRNKQLNFGVDQAHYLVQGFIE